MRAIVRKLGNSSGVIIPKPVLGEVGVEIGDAFDIRIEKGQIVLAPVSRRRRAAWAAASREIAEAGDDVLVWPEFGNLEDDGLIW